MKPISFKKSFWLYITAFVKEQEINFDEDFSDISSQQLKALFTSYCLMFNINEGTAECDAHLWHIFDIMKMDESLMDNFKKFMLEYLV